MSQSRTIIKKEEKRAERVPQCPVPVGKLEGAGEQLDTELAGLESVALYVQVESCMYTV